MTFGKMVLVAMFLGLLFAMPGHASADSYGSQPTQAQPTAPGYISQVGYYGYNHHDACRNPHFQRNHRWLCS